MLQQLAFFSNAETELDQPMNVSKVQQLSPFRYPGGKTWLVPHFLNYFSALNYRCTNFVEAFAGGAIIGITVASRNLADKVTLIELDPEISAVWETIFSNDYKKLITDILTFDVTNENVREYLSRDHKTRSDLAFQTILKNRTFHGGIIAAGSGLLKNGENGKGIKSRWYPETLAKRITYLQTLRDRINVLNQDALPYMKNIDDKNAFVFIDPPYTAPGKKAGKRLYNFHELDHDLLFDISASAPFDFMMTYDENEYVLKSAADRGFKIDRIAMKNTHHAKMYELLITKAV